MLKEIVDEITENREKNKIPNSSKKSESDGSYGDLGVIPTAPNKIGKSEKEKPDNFIFSGSIVNYLD